jgi:hypothetical protein
MNWSSGAFDPKHQIYVTTVNNLPMEVHLIPRDRYAAVETDAKQGRFRAEVSPQHGTPFGMSRGVIRAPSGVPCNPPPWRPTSSTMPSPDAYFTGARVRLRRCGADRHCGFRLHSLRSQIFAGARLRGT